jgi:hypothetical protein
MVRTAGITAGARLPELRNKTRLAALRAGSRIVACLVRWVLFEMLPLPLSTRGHHALGVVCRLVGCAASWGILSVALRASAASHGEMLALLWAASALTAVLIGNVAREFMYGLCASMATWLGHAFQRCGVTLGGRIFLEVHYPSRTWLRYEYGADEFSYEWTEPTGRCNRIDVLFRRTCCENGRQWRPVIRVFTAPRLESD